jgi:hypothetical protein
MRSRKNMVALAWVLVTENALALAFGSSLIASNIACVAAFVFFTMSLSPGSLFGFAVTATDWGKVLWREMRGDYDPDGPELAKAATRSLAILSAFVLLGFFTEFARRSESSFATAVSVLSGMEAGFVAVYLVATRNRSSVS